MTAPVSRILGPAEVNAFNRIGDLMLPRNGDLPSFSELGCVEHIDDVIAHAPPEDIKDLAAVLRVLNLCPTFMLKLLLKLITVADRFPAPLAALLRLLDMGLRSVCVTLYYSGKSGSGYTGKTPLELMGYELNCIRPGETRAS